MTLAQSTIAGLLDWLVMFFWDLNTYSESLGLWSYCHRQNLHPELAVSPAVKAKIPPAQQANVTQLICTSAQLNRNAGIEQLMWCSQDVTHGAMG